MKLRGLNGRKNERAWDFLVCITGFIAIAVVVLQGRWVNNLDGDAVPQTYSLFVFVINAIKNGEFPLWNHALWDGFPSFANPITESMYPINWVLCALFYNSETDLVSYEMIAWNIVIHYTIMFVGIYFLCKRLSCRHFASMCGAILGTFSFSVFNSEFLQWVVSLDAFCYLPAILCVAMEMIDSDSIKNGFKCAVWIGILLGLVALISISSMLIINAVFFGILCLFRLMEMMFMHDYKKLKQYIAYVATIAGIAVLIAIIPLLGTLQFIPNLSRYVPGYGYLSFADKLSYNDFSSMVNSAELLKDFFVVDDTGMSIPLTAVVMMVWGIAWANKDYKIKYLIFACAFSFLYSFGIIMPSIIYHVPLMNAMREPVFYNMYTSVFMSVLSAVGIKEICRMATTENKKDCILPLIISFILIAAVFADPKEHGRGNDIVALLLLMAMCIIAFAVWNTKWKITKANRWINNIVGAIVLLCVGVQSILFYQIGATDPNAMTYGMAAKQVEAQMIDTREELQDYIPTLENERITDWMGKGLLSNVASVLQFDQIMGYINPGYVKATKVHENVLLPQRCIMQNITYVFHDDESDNTELFMAMYPSFEKIDEVEVYTSYNDMEKSNMSVYQTNLSQGSAWIVSEFEWYESGNETQAISLLNSVDLTSTVIIEQNATNTQLVEKAVQGASGQVICRDKKNNSIVYDVEMKGSGLLATSNTYYPGWKVYVDGQHAELIEINYWKCGVMLDEGTHKVEFVFQPLAFLIGFPLMLVGIAGAIVLLVLTREKQTRKK